MQRGIVRISDSRGKEMGIEKIPRQHLEFLGEMPGMEEIRGRDKPSWEKNAGENVEKVDASKGVGPRSGLGPHHVAGPSSSMGSAPKPSLLVFLRGWEVCLFHPMMAVHEMSLRRLNYIHEEKGPRTLTDGHFVSVLGVPGVSACAHWEMGPVSRR